ncbi:unnamed protein product, partial [Prunus brigantina]
ERRIGGRRRREAVFIGSDRFHLWSKAAQRPSTDTLRLFNNQHLYMCSRYLILYVGEMGSNVELVWPESEAYSSRVNNCSHANSSLAAIRAKLSAEQLEQFKTSCFGHLLNIDKIQFSGQIVHGVVLRRVAGQGVKDLDGLSFLIGCDVAQFTRQDFCLITGLRFGEVPEVSSGESDEIRLQKRYFIDEGITCNALEEAFMRCTVEDDIYKLALVYFAELVVLGRDKHLNININYLTLVEDLDAFNRYPWGSVSFDKTQDSLFSAPTKYVKSFENEEGRRKGKSKVTGTSRRNEKGKKDGEVQRGGWSFKGFTYALQIWVYELIPRMGDLNYCKVVDPTALPRILRWRTTTAVPEMRKLNNYFFQSKESVQLRALCPSEEEIRQPYWSWPQDRPAVVSAESIPSSCADLDELNKAVSLLRSELFQVKREKDVLKLKVIRMEKNLDHCLGPHFEQEVRRDIALLKERTNRCVVSHLFKGYEEVDGMQWDEGPSNRNEGEENEEEDIEGGEGPNNRNEGEEKEEEGIERGGEGASKRNEGEEKEDEGIEGGEVQRKPSEVEEAQRKTSEGEQVKIKSSKGEEVQRKSIEGEKVKRKSNEGEELQRKSIMLLGNDIGESMEGTKVEFTLGAIDLYQPTAVLSQLNVWLNAEGKAVERGVQLRKRKRIIPMWKMVEATELVPKNLPETTRPRTLDPMKAIPHDDMVKLLKLCWEWRHNPNLVMQFGNVEAEIDFFASLVKADGWLKGDHIDLGLYLIRKRQQVLEEVEISDWTTTDVFFMNHIHTCFADNKRKKEQVGWKIRSSLVNVVNGKVPACGLDWQHTYKVYVPCMLPKYKHWVALEIDLIQCEIKVYDSMVSLIPNESLKEELGPLSITIPNLLNTLDFYEEGVYANECTRDWWCPWPIHRVDVPQQANDYLHRAAYAIFSVEVGCRNCTGRCLHAMIWVELGLGT